MKLIYIVGAVAGTVIPYYFFLQFFQTQGLDLLTFIQALFANGAASGFTADLLISSAVFWCYLLARKEPLTWLYILLNVSIGLSCALPLYLLMQLRAGSQHAAEQAGQSA